ncbi:MAG: 5'-methylthioadenosine/S-adenosylhomocysteine nucleosidase [Muribaculaceae bacterium]|nr:5'-methylthioadenosine/S-adenosylhomocysteine nucleosidase [Muribaculaceae bacterium]
MIGIIVAMDKELELLLPLIDGLSEIAAGRFKFYCGGIGSREVVVMKCGIGKVNAALATQAMIDRFGPEFIMSTGVAGGAGGRAGILDVVVADRVVYGDVWCGPGTAWGEAAGCPLYLPAVTLGVSESDGVKIGLICSSDRFISTVEDVDFLRGNFPEVMAVDMESGAIAQTCYLADVPFASIRVVSDTPGAGDNIAQYDNFWSDAPKATFNIVKKVLEMS